MRLGKLTIFSLILSSVLLLSNSQLFSQNIAIDNFESYANKDSMAANWRVFGYSSLDFDLVHDSVTAPIGKQFLSYTYSGNAQTTWGGAVEQKDLVNNPLDLSSTTGGLQFYLKGDGTSNHIYVRLSNGSSNWSSNSISVTDTNWHAVYIPYTVDTADGFTNGNLTQADLLNDLSSITDFRIYIDHPVIDSISYTIYFDDIYSVRHLPPQNSIMLEDWEAYRNRDSLNLTWQFFGYPTRDFTVMLDPQNAESGFKYLKYIYMADNTTTWGSAFSTRDGKFTPVDISGKKGIQFYLKGDGSPNTFSFRFYNGVEMWSSKRYYVASCYYTFYC